MGGRTVGILLSVCCMAFGPAGRGSADPAPLGRHEFDSKHMGTLFRVVLYAPDRAAAEAAAKAAFDRVAELDRTMSDYNPKSELMRLCAANDAAPGKPVAVGRDLFDVLEKAAAVSKATDGSFDVTVGPLVELWRTARRTQRLPDAKELAAAKAKVGFDKVTLDAKARTVSLKVPGMRLDLGGIAKGYVADEGLKVLKGLGITRALVAASGDIAVSDPPPGKDGWEVQIAPLSPDRPARTLRLANAAASTSGDLFQFVEIGGVRYSHVLNPKTGLGLTGRRSVTVVAPTGTQADAFSKAASVLPPDKALPVIEGVPGAACFIVVKESDDAAEKVTESKRFGDFLVKPR